MFSLGVNSLPKADPNKVRSIKEWVRSLLNLDSMTTIFVTQIECKEPGCPPVETVVALIRSGETTKQKKTHKSINDIEEKDIAKLFS